MFFKNLVPYNQNKSVLITKFVLFAILEFHRPMFYYLGKQNGND